MEIVWNLALFLLGLAALYYGAEFLVKGGCAIAEKAGISPLVIGLTLVACATSAPELVVSVRAALAGNADISLGNIVGSNICNIALILGLCACITPLSVKYQILRLDAPVMAGSAILLTVFYFMSNGLNRIQGLILFLLFLAYTFWNIYASRKEERAAAATEEKTEEQPKKKYSLFVSCFLVVFGLGLLIAGAELFLKSSIFFAKLFDLSDTIIGLTIVAVGTSLPELATSVVAAIKGEKDIAIGNVVGSNIFNILGILGITPLLSPLKNSTLAPMDFGVMLFCTLILLPMMRSGWKLSRWEGALLLYIYVAYTVWLLLPLF